MEKPIVSNKYKNLWDGSNHNSQNYSIEHLPFGMLYHYSQQLPCTVLSRIFLLTTPGIVIGTYTGLFTVFYEGQRKT